MRPSYKAFRNFEIGSGCTSLADRFDRTWYQVTQDAALVAIAKAPADRINGVGQTTWMVAIAPVSRSDSAYPAVTNARETLMIGNGQ
jgi:predicted dithiol-disulfide oxidoreductase (DUF899 family)